MLLELIFDKTIIKEIAQIIEKLNFEINKLNLEIEQSDGVLSTIDGGNNYFKHEILKFFGASLINLALVKNEQIKTWSFVIFEKVPLKLKIKQLKNIDLIEEIGNAEEILELIGEKDYNFEKEEEEESFSTKVRNLLEISLLLKEEKENKVLRDGSFYLPDLAPLKSKIVKKIKNKDNLMALAKSSKLLRNKLLISSLDKGLYKVNETILNNYYSKENFLFDFPVYLISAVKKSIYQFESGNLENLGIIFKEIKKGKNGYPKSLILADKFAKASERKIKSIERKLLKTIYESEIREFLSEIEEKFYFIRELS